MLVYCDLLKDENTNEVNCEADFHLQAFHQKCTIHGKCIKLCANLAIAVSLAFCQQVAHFFGEESLYNFNSLHIRQCKVLHASSPLLTTTHIYIHT